MVLRMGLTGALIIWVTLSHLSCLLNISEHDNLPGIRLSDSVLRCANCTSCDFPYGVCFLS